MSTTFSMNRTLCFALLLWMIPAAVAAEPAPVADGTQPMPGETVFIPELRGVITVPDAAAVSELVPAGFSGIDTSRTPLLSDPAAAELIRQFLNKPMSFGSLDRLCIGLRTWLRLMGQPFVNVHAPPQEVSAGVIRLVVQRSKLDGELKIEGATYFSEASYRSATALAPGAEIDAVAITDAVNWLGENPYRRATVVAEPGATAGTTRLTLRVLEERPWRLTAGYSNSGTPVTDENRVSASVAWGNAFGRGDQLGYTFSTDPEMERSRSHSANYTMLFRSRRSLTIYGAHAEIESELPAPLTQQGRSWQAGARFSMPLKTVNEWKQSLALTADFKASDNNLEFATIPITDNLTHIAQFGATWSLSRSSETLRGSLAASVFASPGGLTGRNHGRYFDVSRAGAKADYVYGQLQGQIGRALPLGFSWSTSALFQVASGPLLGTEQLNGGGVYGVRGFRESTAFGDEGVVVNNELHLPAFSPFKRRDQADVFVFVDAAALRDLGVGGDSVELASAGIGLNYQVRRHFTLRASYGWQLKELPNVSGGNSHGHVAATIAF
jgi:Hemolysin activation/secretion protein